MAKRIALSYWGALRRLAFGSYDFAPEHRVLGRLLPTAETSAEALSDCDGQKIQPAGASAAQALELSAQVIANLGIAIRVTECYRVAQRFGPSERRSPCSGLCVRRRSPALMND